MEFLKNIQWTPLNLIKATGIVSVAFIGLYIILQMMTAGFGLRTGGLSAPTMMNPISSDMAYNTGAYDSYTEESSSQSKGGIRLSTQNMGMPSPQSGGSTGDDAEAYEATEYTATIETENKNTTCADILQLKTADYVIFENANEHNRGCSFTFKVKQDRVAEVLSVIQSFNPKDLNESTYTIKPQLDDFTSATDELKRKLTVIDETMTRAVSAYDEVTALATQTRDVESLAKIIDSKINIIERLTEQRINIATQLEQLARAKAEQVDRLEYTYFSITVYENKFVNRDDIKDSWKSAVKNFVMQMNSIAQNMTVQLAVLVFMIVQYVFYFFILLVTSKYVWKATKYVWKKE